MYNGWHKLDLVWWARERNPGKSWWEKLQGYGLSIGECNKQSILLNLDFPTGSLKTRVNKSTIRLSGKYKSVEEIEQSCGFWTKTELKFVFLMTYATVLMLKKMLKKLARFQSSFLPF